MDQERLAAEQRARVLNDRQLTEAGWVVQDRRDPILFAGQGSRFVRSSGPRAMAGRTTWCMSTSWPEG